MQQSIMAQQNKIILPQLLKWVGNKHRFAHEIVSYMPSTFNTYIEPFLGSGAVLGTLSSMNKQSSFPKYKEIIASDNLPFLIGIFEYVKNDPWTLIDHYRISTNDYKGNEKNSYIKIRDKFNKEFNPLDFAVLTRTCYSGIIRFRKNDGYMSTPIGPHNPISPESFQDRVLIWHELVKNVTFLDKDYQDVMNLAKHGDLIYCDPPYTHSQSILYGSQNFSIENLWQKIYECKQKGAKIMLSINGKRRSKTLDIGVRVPEGLFERGVNVNCGISMINRLQRAGDIMLNEEVTDKLLFSW